MSGNSLILLDRVSNKIEEGSLIVSWSDMIVPPEITSLPQKTEEQAIGLKEEYLKWIYDLGKSVINGQSLVSYLKIFDNLSFWWLTSIAEKSPFLCESTFQIFKLRTLEKFYYDNHCRGLVYRGNNKNLHSTLSTWLKELDHPYKWIPISSNGPITFNGSIYNNLYNLFLKLPYVLQGLIWFIKKWFKKWRHVSPDKSSAEKSDRKLRPTIVTFFPEIYVDQLKQGNFRSKYWEKLHDHLETKKISVDWVWFYFESKDISFEDSIQFKNKCNRKSSNNQKYFLLEEFLEPMTKKKSENSAISFTASCLLVVA